MRKTGLKRLVRGPCTRSPHWTRGGEWAPACYPLTLSAGPELLRHAGAAHPARPHVTRREPASRRRKAAGSDPHTEPHIVVAPPSPKEKASASLSRFASHLPQSATRQESRPHEERSFLLPMRDRATHVGSDDDRQRRLSARWQKPRRHSARRRHPRVLSPRLVSPGV